MTSDLPLGCPFSGAGRKASVPQRGKKCSVRRQVIDFTVNRGFVLHSLVKLLR